MVRMLLWMATGPLGETDPESKAGELPFPRKKAGMHKVLHRDG